MERPANLDDPDTPNAARLYDYYLGGAHNFAADRAKAREVIDLWPNVVPVARRNRAFLRRVVQHALAAGITQFLDLGSGVPTVGNVHEIALAHSSATRVVYCDYEPVARSHSQLLLERFKLADRVGVVGQDMRDPAAVLSDPEVTRLLDLDRPVCVLMVAVLHFVGPEDDPAGVIDAYRRSLAAGSWFAASHIASDAAPEEQRDQVSRFAKAYATTSNPLHVRDHAEFASWFDGFDLLDPGVTFLPDWRPEGPGDAEEDPTGARSLAWCGVGRTRP